MISSVSPHILQKTVTSLKVSASKEKGCSEMSYPQVAFPGCAASDFRAEGIAPPSHQACAVP